jgi:hypothetical protein
VATLRLVDVAHLFLVPRIRTSDYLQMLSASAPGIAASAPGEVRDAALPALRNVVVLDDAFAPRGVAAGAARDIKSAVDFRDVFVWEGGGHGREERAVRALADSLHQDDIINMQFTSCVAPSSCPSSAT